MSKIKQATKHTGRAQKEQIVAELVEKLDNSNALVLADYQGLKHKQLEDLKKELKKLDATIVVTKNSLLRLSLGKSKNFADYKDNKSLDRPTAALFIQADYVEPLKKLAKVIKAFGLPKIKLGILEGQALNAAEVLKIASLPNRETLLAQLVRTLNSPIQGLVVTLNGNIQKFVMVLDAIARLPRPASPLAEQSEAAREPSDGGQAQAKPSVIVEPAAPAAVAEPDQTNTQADHSTPAVEQPKNESEENESAASN